MKKEKIHLEYLLNATSKNILLATSWLTVQNLQTLSMQVQATTIWHIINT